MHQNVCGAQQRPLFMYIFFIEVDAIWIIVTPGPSGRQICCTVASFEWKRGFVTVLILVIRLDRKWNIWRYMPSTLQHHRWKVLYFILIRFLQPLNNSSNDVQRGLWWFNQCKHQGKVWPRFKIHVTWVGPCARWQWLSPERPSISFVGQQSNGENEFYLWMRSNRCVWYWQWQCILWSTRVIFKSPSVNDHYVFSLSINNSKLYCTLFYHISLLKPLLFGNILIHYTRVPCTRRHIF